MTEMQQQIIKWLANGETGTSSKTMAFVIGFDVIQVVAVTLTTCLISAFVFSW